MENIANASLAISKMIPASRSRMEKIDTEDEEYDDKMRVPVLEETDQPREWKGMTPTLSHMIIIHVFELIIVDGWHHVVEFVEDVRMDFKKRIQVCRAKLLIKLQRFSDDGLERFVHRVSILCS